MKIPIKIIFDDKSEEDFVGYDILEYIDEHDIRSFAEWDLGLEFKDYYDIEKDIDDYDDAEILGELLHRYKIHKDIISINKLNEFLNNFYNL